MNEWISVKDRNPPVSHDEILIQAGSIKRLARYLANTKGGFSFYDAYDEEIKYPVKFWLLIPKNPEEIK